MPTLFCLELYFELFSCNAPASARRLIRNLLTYFTISAIVYLINNITEINKKIHDCLNIVVLQMISGFLNIVVLANDMA